LLVTFLCPIRYRWRADFLLRLFRLLLFLVRFSLGVFLLLLLLRILLFLLLLLLLPVCLWFRRGGCRS
jgi:hypothetical protein